MLAVAVPQRLVRLVVIVLEARLVRLIDVTALGLPTLHAVSVWATTPMSTSALEVTSSVALTVAQALCRLVLVQLLALVQMMVWYQQQW